MLVLNAEKLEQQGIPYRAASKILFQDKTFVKGQSLAKRLRRVAIDLCKSYINSGVLCLVVETGEHFTLWREDNVDRIMSKDAVKSLAASVSRSGEPVVTYSAEEGVIRIRLNIRKTTKSLNDLSQAAKAIAHPLHPANS